MENKYRDQMTVDNKYFSTPDMGEFMSNRTLVEMVGKDDITEGEGALFYVERPFDTVPGYYPKENVFILSGKPIWSSEPELKFNPSLAKFDGDTLHLAFNEIVDGGKSFIVEGHPFSSPKDYIYQTCDLDSNVDELSIRFLGINAPETPKYRTIDNVEGLIFHEINIKTIKENTRIIVKDNLISRDFAVNAENFHYLKYKLQNNKFHSLADKNAAIKFVASSSGTDHTQETHMYQVVNARMFSDDYATHLEKENKLLICTGNQGEDKASYHEQGLKIIGAVKKEIEIADEVIYILDNVTLKTKSGDIPEQYKKSYEKMRSNPFEYFEELYKFCTKEGVSDYNRGYRFFGQDFHGRCLGSVYYRKMEGGKSVWINLAKRLIHDFNEIIVLPTYSSSPEDNANFGYAANVFRLWTYDKSKVKYIDSLIANSILHDDRHDIQKKINPMYKERAVKNHTMLFGDCLFMVPPTSIRVVTQTESMRVPLMRAKGSMVKTIPKSEKILQIDLFFNKEDGINGIKTVWPLPNGDEAIYHMNGIRALIAQFRLTPFLPISNNYVNNDLGIEAVTLNSYEVTTMPNFPRTLKCTITVTEFSYRQYMPEVLPPDINAGEDIFTNLFAKTIHWPVFRYYYQKIIQNGEVLDSIEYNSDEYVEKTLGQRTALQKSHFKTPMMQFYIANEESLKKRFQLKKQLESRPLENKIEFGDDERQFLFKVGKLYGSIKNALETGGTLFQTFNDEIGKALDRNSSYIYGVVNYEDSMEIVLPGNTKDKHIPGDRIKRINKGIPPEIVDGSVWTTYVVPAVNQLFQEIFNSIKNSGIILKVIPWYRSKSVKKHDEGVAGPEMFLGVKIEFDWSACPTVGFENKLRKFVAKKLVLTEEDVFRDGVLHIGYDGTADKKEYVGAYHALNSKFSSSSTYSATDMRLLSLIANLFGMQFDASGIITNESDIDVDKFFDEMDIIGGIKDDLDIESSKSIKFDEYFIGYPIVTDISFSYNNVLNTVSLKATDGQASQYMGGSDTVINVTLIAKDDFTVRQLDTLPRICTRRLLDFRTIMTSSPLRLKCDIAQMMGINEVILESVSIDTIEDQPQARQISIRMISVDRTLRNRESFKKIDHDNAQNVLNTGVYAKNYFDLKKTLKHVELYPDLELPTISELSQKGFEFIGYKMKEDLIFPEPDFYFVYNHLFTSDAIKETITKFFSEEERTTAVHEIVGSLDSGLSNVTFDFESVDGPIVKATVSGKEPEDDPGSMTSYKKKYLESATEIMKGMDTKEYDINNNKKTVREMQDAVGQYQLVTELKECLEYSNHGTITYNLINKPSVSNGKPLGIQKNLMLNDKIDYFDREKGYMVNGNLDDSIDAMNDTLKYFIENILAKPIPTSTSMGASVAQHPDYKKFFDYLFFTVMKVSKDNDYSNPKNPWIMKGDFEISGMFNDITVKYKDVMKDLFMSLSSGATGEIGRITADIGEETRRWRGSAKLTMTIDNGEGKNATTEKVDNIRIVEKGQGLSAISVAKTDAEKKEGIMFGQYGIKKMSPSFIGNLYGMKVFSSDNDFIDPYYNSDLAKAFLKQDLSEEDAAKRADSYRSIIMEESECTGTASHAIFRIMLVWMYRALSTDNQGLIPNSMYSIRRVEEYCDEIEDLNEFFGKDAWDWMHNTWNSAKTIFTGEAGAREKEIEKEIMDKREQVEDEAKKLIKGLPKSVSNHKFSLYGGMWTMLGMLALGELNTPVWGAIQTGSIGELDNYLLTQKDGYVEEEKVAGITNSQINRFLQSMDYVIHDDADMAVRYQDKMNEFKPGAIANRVYMQMAEKPSIYMLHSFYDMVMNDMRGRMARAFPTFYMLLIDEGKHIGIWKLQDNFYDVSSITEIQVVKSRKIAADTANITMTNIFGTYTLEDEDIKDEYNYTFKDVWNSVFHVRDYYNKEYHRRHDARDINRANIVPGTRVHLRGGFAGDANKLPILFNGVVAEIQEGDLMTLICQGNGIQVANPSMFNATDADDVSDLEHNSDIFKGLWGVFSSRSTPRSILTSPLIAKGTFVQNLIKRVSNSRFYSANPFGITSFGDREMKEIFNVDGEVCQNIYEGMNSSSWNTGKNNATSLAGCYNMEEAPQVRVELAGNRSYWDLMHIAASISPDYICAIADFDLRSTIFHGHPRYYCAYSYVKNSTGSIVEKRKPFQQYHVFTSESDIISNMITASQKDIRTNARGIYTGPGVLTETVKTIGPLFLDINIYPENQQSTTINCDFQYKASDFPLTVPIHDWYQDKYSDIGGYEIAWRATVNGLRETVKEMYKGELTVMGYPSIKPFDRFYLSDTYEDMQGLLEVQQVVHTMSADIGFVTSITPDCISSIMDDYDKAAVTLLQESLQPAIASMFAISVMSARFIKTTRPMFMTASNFLADNSKAATDIINKIGKTLGPEDLVIAQDLFPEKDLKKLRFAAGITDADFNIQRAIHKIETAAGKIPKFATLDAESFKSRKDMMELFDDFENFGASKNDLNPAELEKVIDEALESKTITPKTRKTLEDAKEYTKLLDQEYKAINAGNAGSKLDKNELNILYDKALIEIDGLADEDDIKKMINKLKVKGDIFPGDADSLKDLKNVMKNVPKIDDDMAKALVRMHTKAYSGVDNALDGYRGIKNGFKATKLIAAGGVVATTVATIIPVLISMGAEFIITKSIQDYLEKSLKGLQVLTVFPVSKKNKAYTAGLMGSQGSVFGSASYSEEGHFQKMMSAFFTDKPETSIGTVGAFVRDMFLDTGSIRAILGQQQNMHKESDVMLKNNDGTLLQQELLHQIVSSETSGINAYKQLFLVPRYSLDDRDSLNIAVAGNKLEGISNIEDNRRVMDELGYIFESKEEGLNILRYNGVLKFSAEGKLEKGSDGTASLDNKKVTFKYPGNTVEFSCKTITREGKFPIYDIPYLKGDAVILLWAIIEKAAIKIQPDYKSPSSDFKELHSHNIIIQNGTRINDTSYYNTGYAFSIEVKNSNVLGNILEEMKVTQDTANGVLFNYRKDKKLNNVYEVFVAPRK